MLETRFPRLPGDIGNPSGFEFPMIYKIVVGASPKRVVQEQSPALLKPFINAAKLLETEGAEIITTSCGFLAMFQSELQEVVSVPVITSSLLLLPELIEKYGEHNVGVLTISAQSFSRQFRDKVGISDNAPVGTTAPDSEFAESILMNKATFDVEQCRRDNVNAAGKLVEDHPNLKAIVLECTNMPPYASDIVEQTGLPVYSLNTLVNRLAYRK